MRFSTAPLSLPVRLNPDVPAEWERIIDKCLEKDRDLRYQSASDIRADLQRLKRDTDSGRVAPNRSRSDRRIAETRQGAWSLRPRPCWRSSLRVTSTRVAPPILTDKDTIVLADFTNTTGDPVFDGTLRQGSGGTAPAVAVSQPHFRRAYPGGAASDGPAAGCAAHAGARQRTSASEPQAPPCWRARLPASEASTSWGCARRTAAPATCSMRNRCRPREKKTS